MEYREIFGGSCSDVQAGQNIKGKEAVRENEALRMDAESGTRVADNGRRDLVRCYE